MNKGLLFAVVLAAFGAVAWAQDAPASIGLGAWGRAIFTPLVGTTDGLSEDISTSWDKSPRVGFNVHGDSASIGFHADINVDGGTIAAGDQQYIWVKPIDKVTVWVGKFWYDDLRGNAGDSGSFAFLRPFDWAGEDLTFQRARTDNLNAVVATDLVENLKVFVNIQGNRTYENMVKSLQYGAGYTVPGIGQVRAQYIGAEKLDGTDRFNAMVNVTAVPGFNLDAGVFYPMDATKANLKYGADADYSLMQAKAHVLTSYELPKGLDAQLEVGAGLDYDLGSGFALTSDFRYQNKARSAAKVDGGVQAAFAGVTKDYSNGRVGIGFQWASTSFNMNGNSWTTFKAPAVDNTKLAHFAVPILLQYWW